MEKDIVVNDTVISLIDALSVMPMYIQDAVNNAIHTSSVNGRERPITLAFIAVAAALKAKEEHDATPGD